MKLVNRKIILVWVFLFLVSFLGIKTNVYATERRVFTDKVGEKVNSTPYVSNEVIVKFKKDKIDLSSTFSISSQLRMLIFNWTNNYETEDTLKTGNILVLKLKDGQNIDEVINILMSDPSVEYAEPNYYRKTNALTVNDTYKTNLWGLDNLGQTLTLASGATAIGTIGADIDIARAWNLSTGSSDVIVAVIDSGVAYTHPDLIDSMWDGSNCKDENGTTIVGGCLHGYDYVNNDNDPLPTDSTHGTQVAGVLAATSNNNKGIVGVGPKIKIMAIRFAFDTVSEVKAIDFAIQNGAKVINASFGGSTSSDSELAAINRFREAGGIFITSAGNEAANNDLVHVYPSDYSLDNIISVAATDQNDELASFSNIGATSVDVAAPGENIFSTNDEILKVDYNFDNYAFGTLPPTWTSDLGTSWNVIGGDDKQLWVDESLPYIEGVNSVITADTLDLSTVSNAKFTFDTFCDTEDTNPNFGGDYMSLEISSDGSSFSELVRWNEYSLNESFGSNSGNFDSLTLSSQYFTNTFKYRLRWKTDTNGDTGTNGEGCSVNNFKLATYTDGSDENYGYVNGTSMAAPYVSGLIGYLWSVNPSALTSEIVTNVLSNGDTLASLSGKTVTGRRINAYNSLVALGGFTYPGPAISGLSNDSLARKSKTWTWSSDNPSTDQYRFLIDQVADSVPSGVYSTVTTTTFSTGSGTFYIHVQGKDASENEGSVTTASFVLDNSGPVASVGSSDPNIIILSFGENLYNNVGETIADTSSVASKFSDMHGYGVGISAVVYNNQTVTIGLTGTPVAGSEIYTLGTSADKFYDNLGNASDDITLIFNGDIWQKNPDVISIDSSRINELIDSERIYLSGGSTPETALSMNVAYDLLINIGASGTNSSIGLDFGTTISELDDQNFNANLISGTQVDLSLISNLEVGYSAQGAIQWGIPGVSLKFSNPIQINMYLGSEYDGQGMNIYRSSSLSSGWTNSGLSSTLCTITTGYCSFTATEASYYVAAYYGITTPTPTPTQVPDSGGNNNNNNNQSSSSNNNSAPSCNDRVPLSKPDLFKISTTKGSAKIVYTPVTENITGYVVMYGLKKGDERYAAMINTLHNNHGEQSFTINKLNPRVTYYFKVAAVNGCVSGPWSDWIPAKADRKKDINKYKTVIKNKVRTLVSQFK